MSIQDVHLIDEQLTLRIFNVTHMTVGDMGDARLMNSVDLSLCSYLCNSQGHVAIFLEGFLSRLPCSLQSSPLTPGNF